MSKTLVQPVGQKRLTNVAVVRLKKGGFRFEVACYKNKVLEWRSGVEKDLDEVLQSQTVYLNVSKATVAGAVEMTRAFGHDNHSKICLEILEKGELQVAGKERESQYSNQFRDIATIVMEKTINPKTQRPYTISMIERLMREMHFNVDPQSSSKKQALQVIRELQKHFPIKRAPMRLRLTVPAGNLDSLMEKLSSFDAKITAKDSSADQISVVCDIDPGCFRDCDALVRNLQGRLDMLAVSAQMNGDTQVDEFKGTETPQSPVEPKSVNEADSVLQLSESLKKQNLSTESTGDEQGKKRCSTCNAIVGDANQYREHFKTDWHKHNLKRKTKQLPPLTAEECMADMELGESKADLKEYSF